MFARCAGPCYRRCACSHTLRALALMTIIKTLASIMYLMRTRNMGTPFKDSLNEEQLAIKAREAKKRGAIFWQSIFASALLCAIAESMMPERFGTRVTA